MPKIDVFFFFCFLKDALLRSVRAEARELAPHFASFLYLHTYTLALCANVYWNRICLRFAYAKSSCDKAVGKCRAKIRDITDRGVVVRLRRFVRTRSSVHAKKKKKPSRRVTTNNQTKTKENTYIIQGTLNIIYTKVHLI